MVSVGYCRRIKPAGAQCRQRSKQTTAISDNHCTPVLIGVKLAICRFYKMYICTALMGTHTAQRVRTAIIYVQLYSPHSCAQTVATTTVDLTCCTDGGQ